MKNQRFVGYRKVELPSKTVPILIFMAVLAILCALILLFTDDVHETYTERSYRIEDGVLYESEYIKETIATKAAFSRPKETFLELETAEKLEVASSEEEIKHFPESTYIKGAIMLTGEAGGVKSLTEQSGCLWVACNRVDSNDPFFPDDLESVIEQACQFNGYTPNGTYTIECYNLTVDVFERWYREKHGETAVSVGRSLPIDYLYFTGDGEHNYFRKTQDGAIYVWGSQLVSPYKN